MRKSFATTKAAPVYERFIGVAQAQAALIAPLTQQVNQYPSISIRVEVTVSSVLP
jgi:hypothetical protein